MEKSMVGRGREAISMVMDQDTFEENQVGFATIQEDLGPGAVVGTGKINGETVTILANDALAVNPRFPVVYFGVIGMEEAYKMALAVYHTMEADREKSLDGKRPIVLIVDTPGNGPGKVEEIIGMNKATGAYQLALAEARKEGHPVVAMVIGRAISGAFLCHGLQADEILSLPAEYGTMIHVMPVSSISRITKIDGERLERMSKDNPVFAAGAEFFYRLGGINELVKTPEQMKEAVGEHIRQIRCKKSGGDWEYLGPMGRGKLGEERGGRRKRAEVLSLMREEFEAIAGQYLT